MAGVVTDIKNLFDSYGRQARLFPALLTVFAPLLTALAWFPELLTSHVGTTLLTLATSCGLLYWMSSIARSRGKVVEQRLLREWGGWPTTYLLRHSSRLERQTRERYHKYLTAHVPGLKMPKPADEARDAAAADEAYASAVRWLKEHVRKKAPMVDRENAQYGFRRNMRGMRLFGMLGAILALSASLIAIMLQIDHWPSAAADMRPFIFSLKQLVHPAVWGAVVVDFVATLAWSFTVTDAWVRSAGEQYAEALFATCDQH